jgi:hypothetical protein
MQIANKMSVDLSDVNRRPMSPPETEHRRARDARMAICGVRRIQFIGTADPLHLIAAVDCIANWKHVIAGNAKAVVDSFCDKALDDVISVVDS